jgi:urate oxidase
MWSHTHENASPSVDATMANIPGTAISRSPLLVSITLLTDHDQEFVVNVPTSLTWNVRVPAK